MINKFALLAGTAFLLFLYFAQDAFAQETATLFLDPATQTVAQGGSFSVEIRANTGGQQVNTVAANLIFDQQALTAQSVDTSGSFVTIWFENNIASGQGEVRLTGSVPSPGVSTDNLLFARVNFTANTPGPHQIQFKDDSAMFRNSDNVNILADSQGSIVTVTADGEAVTPTAGPTPTVGSGTPTPDTTDTPTITPTGLPDAGITTPTLILFTFALLLIIVAIAFLL